VLNGKSYVGYTEKSITRRWNEHVAKSKNKKNLYAFANALRKYGVLYWKHDVLEVIQTSCNDAQERERFWISKLKCRGEFGYNLTDGGNGASGRVTTDVTRKKQSVAALGKKFSLEHVDNIKNALTGRTYTEKERQRHLEALTDDVKAQISKKLTGRKLSEQHVRNMCIMRTEPFVAMRGDEIIAAFMCSSDIINILGINVQRVNALKNNTTCCGHAWRKIRELTEMQRVRTLELLREQYTVEELRLCRYTK